MFDVTKVDATIEHVSESICSIDIKLFADVDHVKDMMIGLAELIKARAKIEKEEYISLMQQAEKER